MKRQKTDPARKEEAQAFIKVACPTKSGEKSPTLHQYTTNKLLYDSYCNFTPQPYSFRTLWTLKKATGQLTLRQVLQLLQCDALAAVKLAQVTASIAHSHAEELRKCRLHKQTSFLSPSTSQRCGVSSARVSCWC